MSEETYRVCVLVLNILALLMGGLLFVAAVWRDAFSKKIIRPKLRLQSTDFPEGEGTVLGDKKQPARYWHADVENETPWIQAESVELFLLEFSVGPVGAERVQPMPGSLTFIARRGLTEVPVGYKSVTYDLFRYVDGVGFELRLRDSVPNNLQRRLTAEGSFTALIQAKGDNGRSNKLLINLKWNGRGTAESIGKEITLQAREILE